MKMTTDDLRMSVHQAGFSHVNLIIKTPPSHHYFDRSSVLTSKYCSFVHFENWLFYLQYNKTFLSPIVVSKMFPDPKRGFIILILLVDVFNCVWFECSIAPKNFISITEQTFLVNAFWWKCVHSSDTSNTTLMSSTLWPNHAITKEWPTLKGIKFCLVTICKVWLSVQVHYAKR